jgi:hypothetical protein
MNENTGLGGRFSLVFLHMTLDLCINLAMFFNTHDKGVMRLPDGQGFSIFLTHDMGKFEKNLVTSRKNIRKPFFSPRRTLH